MFTGIIEKIAEIYSVKGNGIELVNPFGDADIKTGDSVAVNGVCLTVSGVKDKLLLFDASGETFSKTTLSRLNRGDQVNAERALKTGARVGGHFVSGHVDETGILAGKEISGGSYVFSFRVPVDELLAEKGSVAVDGISLTCYGIKGGIFKTSVIPHTFENTNLKFLKKGGAVNIEFDLLARYALKKTSKIDLNFLKENGYF